MKTNFKFLAIATAAVLALTVFPILGQDSTAATQSAATVAPAPQLSYGASEILKLAQSNVGDGTIIAYIKYSKAGYDLDANQIVYLRQQGVSEAVISTMLNQPKAVAIAAAPPAPEAAPAPASPAPTTVVTPAPTVTYVQTAPLTPAYDYPAYYPSYYPGYYYPPVAFSFGWGWGGHWGGGWRGGHGGWRR